MNFMEEALKQAEIAFENDEVPVGAVIVENGKIIASAFNQNRFLNDCTAHAEILALRKAGEIKKNYRLDECDLYVTLEPCAMCAAAISNARIRRVYYSAADQKFGAIENGVKFFANAASCYHRPEVYSGFCVEDSERILKRFFLGKRR